MAKTCIICEGPAGSGEHVFPAALGGRRTNKGIYCPTHDNGYSSLVSELADQLDVFNSLLGVRPDHADSVKIVRTYDENTGQEIKLSVNASSFTKPRILSQETVENGAILNMSFPDQQSIATWISEREAEGMEVRMQAKGETSTYILGPVHFKRKLGGAYGLGALAYVAQTFLAQSFPDLARSESIVEFKKYTVMMALEAKTPLSENIGAGDKLSAWKGDAPIWWDFDPQPDQTPNAFPFGHRVMVGVDALDGLIYGRISLFSALHFSMIFGVSADASASKVVTIDIDPLAEHPPNDILKTETTLATTRVLKPKSQTDGLANAIAENTPEIMFSELLRKIGDYSMAKTAKGIILELSNYSDLSVDDVKLKISAVLEKNSQRVWNLVRSFVANLKESPFRHHLGPIWPALDELVEHDFTSANGLSTKATISLEVVKRALLAEMIKDHEKGNLNELRLIQLLGEGAGLAVVGGALIGCL